ncbi:hypothetical protein DCW30_06650 [Streptomyces alfalfae]|uniref:Lipoprotein n=1 Tax=Streptomyces alfalfae TaxID=1642299 RepID=A0ABN4VSA0_9ACTN|nr:hypothetical protein A7J05_22230 [Streptomyces alfalfae]AYA18435.1 hypothetical protein D3X13_21335 [Streptomyces fradiae]RXX46158.1 hypothetical protein DCW30_06650 [Streptomyces alfalfae]RZM92173.1 hypothetical protein D4104_21685 [Streptomyces alfalfae]
MLMLGAAAGGCAEQSVGGPSGSTAKHTKSHREPEDKPDSRVVEDDDDHTVLELSDGRQVSLRFTRRGLEAQHRHASDEAWSARKTVYETGAEPCQGIRAKAYRDTVWLAAGFGKYCRDGEEPQEVIAAVATGDLSSWTTDPTKNNMVWPKARIRDGGARVDFVDRSFWGTTTLTWRKGSGFAKAATEYKPIHPWFVGRWRATDGSQQLSIHQVEPGRWARVVIETRTGPRCKGSAIVTGSNQHDLSMSNFKLEQGTRTVNCPLDELKYDFDVKSSDGPLRLRKIGNHPKTVLTYERAG